MSFAQYLSKFLPRLSDVMKPFWELTLGIASAKSSRYVEAVDYKCTSIALLFISGWSHYTMWCITIWPGCNRIAEWKTGCIFIMCFDICRNANWEKLLAIVFAHQYYSAYIYGRESVQVELDHKPLVLIMQKLLIKAPCTLHKMLLKLQR